ncbi:hypothetical protein IBP95_000194 [Vibrio vulnificus]|nr:hypothetical protein [Vibrio vulnificus]
MKNMKATAAQDTATAQEFNPTPLTKIVEIYSEQFKPSITTEERYIQTHEIARENVTTQVNVHADSQVGYIVNKQNVTEARTVLTKKVVLKCSTNKQHFMQIVQELMLEHGWRVAEPKHGWNVDASFQVVLERPLSSYAEDDERIKASYQTYLKDETEKQREAYFALDKVQQFVEEYEQREREEHMKAKADSIQSILSSLNK